MKNIKIKSLKLSNFKGIKDFEITNFSNGISIYGDNATGKTTIFDAFSWLLFGKDSLNSTAFEIKTLDESGQALHGLEHAVEAILITETSEISLRKVYSEKYTVHRGKAKKTFTGHTVDHFVNGVPCRMKEFNTTINHICTEDIFRLLTNSRYFNEVLHWRKRREILFEICGDISDSDVIALNPNLKDLPDILGDNTKDQQKKIITTKQAEINEQLKKIPVRIDEITASKIEVTNDGTDFLSKINIYKQTKIIKEKELAALKSGGGIELKEKELAKMETTIINHENQILSEKQERLKKQGAALKVAEDKSIAAARATEKAVICQTQTIDNKKNMVLKLKKMVDDRGKLREEWLVVDERKFTQDYKAVDTCPACGQKLQKEKVEEALRLTLEAFNETRATDMGDLAKKGKDVSDQILITESDITKITKTLKRMDTEIQTLANNQDKAERTVDLLEAEHERINVTLPPDLILDDLISQRDTISFEINGILAGANENIMAVEGEIERADTMLNNLKTDELQVTANTRIDQRVIQLGLDERKLSAEFEQLESELFLIETFVRDKAALLQPRIANKFKYANFRLFTANINGGLEECCDTVSNGVPYNSMNNGARINISLDICNALSNYHGISLPIFIDNSEAVTDLLNTNAQQIRLFVSKGDKKLRIEKQLKNIP